jgi:hypothetical protein
VVYDKMGGDGADSEKAKQCRHKLKYQQALSPNCRVRA